jgi:hypothetical protein
VSLLLPVDDNGNSLPVLGFDPLGTQKVTASSSSERIPAALDDDIQLVTLIATGPCRFEIGDNAVTADRNASPFLYPGIYVDVPLRRSERHVAFIAEADDCIAYVIGRR